MREGREILDCDGFRIMVFHVAHHAGHRLIAAGGDICPIQVTSHTGHADDFPAVITNRDFGGDMPADAFIKIRNQLDTARHGFPGTDHLPIIANKAVGQFFGRKIVVGFPQEVLDTFSAQHFDERRIGINEFTVPVFYKERNVRKEVKKLKR